MILCMNKEVVRLKKIEAVEGKRKSHNQLFHRNYVKINDSFCELLPIKTTVLLSNNDYIELETEIKPLKKRQMKKIEKLDNSKKNLLFSSKKEKNNKEQ